MAYAQGSLAPLRGLLAHRNRAYDAQLHDIVALLAYEDPLVRFHMRAHANADPVCPHAYPHLACLHADARSR